ncbi:MAG: ABC transporter permease subunit [Dethiobacter sp.]|nr:ABC transporter permease subunit [Dethiobacter sp.]
MGTFTGSLNKYLYLGGVIVVLLGWEIVSLTVAAEALPRPREVWNGLMLLHTNGKLWQHLPISLYRTLMGFGLGAALGFIAGALAGFSKPLYCLLKPLTGALLSFPAVAVVMVGMVWFGMGSTLAVVITALFTFPLVYRSTVEGVRLMDARLLEMAAVFRLSKWALWWNIYLPALATALLAGFAFAAGTAFRKTVMAELLGSHDGVGYAMAMTRFNLETAELFAWVMVCLFVVAGIELLAVRPAHKYLRLWNLPDEKRRGALKNV